MSMTPGAGTLIDLIAAKLSYNGQLNDWSANQLALALQRVIQNPYSSTPAVYQVDENSLHNLSDSTMIHEMLRRGYAVMKVPASGKPEGLT